MTPKANNQAKAVGGRRVASRWSAWVLAVAVAVVGACDGDGGSAGSADAGVPPGVTPPVACRAMADAFGRVCERCMLRPYRECYNLIDKINGAGTCDLTGSIRDVRELYGTCIPWLNNLTCAEASSRDFQFDPSCLYQLRGP